MLNPWGCGCPDLLAAAVRPKPVSGDESGCIILHYILQISPILNPLLLNPNLNKSF